MPGPLPHSLAAEWRQVVQVAAAALPASVPFLLEERTWDWPSLSEEGAVGCLLCTPSSLLPPKPQKGTPWGSACPSLDRGIRAKGPGCSGQWSALGASMV